MKLASEPASSRPRPYASLKNPHESCPFTAPCDPRRKKTLWVALNQANGCGYLLIPNNAYTASVNASTTYVQESSWVKDNLPTEQIKAKLQCFSI